MALGRKTVARSGAAGGAESALRSGGLCPGSRLGDRSRDRDGHRPGARFLRGPPGETRDGNNGGWGNFRELPGKFGGFGSGTWPRLGVRLYVSSDFLAKNWSEL